MWQKKTEPQSKEEIEEQKTRFRPDRIIKAAKSSVLVFFTFLIFRIIYALFVSSDYRPYNIYPSKPVSLSELPQYLTAYLFSAFIIAIIVFAYQYITNKEIFAGSSTLMCDQCFKTKNFDKLTNCDCGGTYSSIENFEWIEDDKQEMKEDYNWVNKYRINKNEG